MSALHLLSSGNYIVVNRSLIHELGLSAAVLLGELASENLYWAEHEPASDGWFFSTVENVEHNTGLTAYEQRAAFNKLLEAQLVDVKRGGMPAKRYIRVNSDAVVKFFNNKKLKNLTTRSEKTEQQVVKNLNGNNKTTNKNRKKELSNKYMQQLEAILDANVMIKETPELRAAFVAFIKMREFIKHPLDDGGLNLIIKKVYKLGNGDAATMQAILERSVENSWRGVFELPQQKAARTGNEFDALL